MEIKSQGLGPEVRGALAKVAAHLGLQARDDPGSIVRLAGLFERGGREEELFSILLDLVPAEVDAGAWLAWFDGGVAISRPAKRTDPDADRKMSARGAQVAAVRRRDEAQRQVQLAETKLSDAQSALMEAEQSVRATDQHLRQVVAHRMMYDIAGSTAGLFAMGPAWTLMRCVSGYIRHDAKRLEELDPEAREKVEELVANGRKDSAEMLDLLDLYAGDVLLELRLRAVILSTLRKHHEPIARELEQRATSGNPLSPSAKRLHRKSEERAATVRAGVGILSDRHDVLDGLKPVSDPHEDTAS